MMIKKLSFVIVAIVCFVFVQPKHCTQKENTIFASDGTYCHVFRNDHHMARVKYYRSFTNKPDLSIVTKEVCQTQCIKKCGISELGLVCGEYNGTYLYYVDRCALQMFACVFGQSIVQVPNRKCDN